MFRRPTSAHGPDTFTTKLVEAWPWLVCALVLPLLSLAAPRDPQLPITFAIPVVFVARRHSFALAGLLAVGMPLLRLIGVLILDLALSGWIAVANFDIRVVVLVQLAFLVNSLLPAATPGDVEVCLVGNPVPGTGPNRDRRSATRRLIPLGGRISLSST